MKVLGIKMSDTVVCYDTGDDQLFGYRGAWILQAFGHPKSLVLDGGFKKWKYENLPLETSEEYFDDNDFDFKF